MNSSYSCNCKNATKINDLLDRVNKQIQLNYLHEKEREEAKYLIERFYHENRMLNDELSYLKVNSGRLAIEQQNEINEAKKTIEKLRKELGEHIFKVEHFDEQLAKKNEKIKLLNQQVDSKQLELEFYEKELNILDSELISLRNKQFVNTSKMNKFKKLKKYLFSHQIAKLGKIVGNRDSNDETKVRLLDKLQKSAIELERFHIHCLDNILAFKSEIEQNMNELTLEPIKIVKIDLNSKRLFLKNITLKPISIGKWRIRILDSSLHELEVYKFDENFCLLPQTTTQIELFDNLSNKEMIKLNDLNNNNENECTSGKSLLKLLKQMDLVCVLENECEQVSTILPLFSYLFENIYIKVFFLFLNKRNS
jgi:hypothetical protein